MRRKILIVGHGYFGRQLSQILPIDTFEITVTSRNADEIKPNPGRFDHVIEFDVTNPAANPIEQKFDSIVYCVGYDRSREQTRYQVYCLGLQNFLEKLKCPPRNFIYISSTGVFSQNSGQWVDEKSETEPHQESGNACLAAEEALSLHGLCSKVRVLRFAGIYGPGRVPNREKVLAGRGMDSAGYLNLIHVYDAARITWGFLDGEESVEKAEAADQVKSGLPQRNHSRIDPQSDNLPVSESLTQDFSIFNVSDGVPVLRSHFYQEIANQLGIENFPPQAESEAENKRASTNKRISNRKLVNETGYQFEYPDYQAGLRDALREK